MKPIQPFYLTVLILICAYFISGNVLSAHHKQSCGNPVTSLEIPKGTNNINSAYYRTSSDTIASWHVIEGNIDFVAVGAYRWKTQGGIMVDSGSRDGKVTTDITTTPGQTYDFIFYHAHHNYRKGPHTGRVEILDNSTILQALDVSSTISVTEQIWHKEIITFTATSNKTTITLEQTTNNAGYGNVYSGMGYRQSCENPSPISKTLIVKATDTWLDTGLDIQAGDQLIITTQGKWQVDGKPETIQVNADGYGIPLGGTPFNGSFAALIGRISNDGESFLVGNSLNRSIPNTGRLFLQINDVIGTLEDNQGELEVTIDIK